MTFLSQSHRAPAETTHFGLRRIIRAAIDSKYWPTRLCFHRHLSIPLHNRQHCLDCGATRSYLFHSDFEHADAGIVAGEWKRPKPMPHNTARQVAENSARISIELGLAELGVRK